MHYKLQRHMRQLRWGRVSTRYVLDYPERNHSGQLRWPTDTPTKVKAIELWKAKKNAERQVDGPPLPYERPMEVSWDE